MKTVTSTDEYTIYQRRDGRYAVKAADKSAINGDEKVKILVEHELIAAALPAEPEPEPEPVEESADAEAAAEAEESSEEAAAEEASEDAPADEASADEASAEDGDAEEDADHIRHH